MSSFEFGSAYEENEGAISGDVLPEGEYEVEVKSAKSVTTGGGKPAIRLQLIVIGGPNAGRTVPDQRTWSPESEPAMRIFRQSMEILGATKQWIVSTGATGDQIADKIVGARAVVFLKVGDFNGQPRNDVSYKRPLQGGGSIGGGGESAPFNPSPASIPPAPAQATSTAAWPS